VKPPFPLFLKSLSFHNPQKWARKRRKGSYYLNSFFISLLILFQTKGMKC
jgi:hypothetical protein